MLDYKELEGLVVSCQALENEPLYGGDTMLKMAVAAVNAGAIAIRTNGGVNVKMIKEALNVPVIGLTKTPVNGYEVYITPTFKEVTEICEAGADVVAIDATDHTRPVSLEELVRLTKEKYPNVLLMADISTYDEAIRAEKIGFDMVGTTMVGYTPHTENSVVPDLSLLKSLVDDLKIPVIAEGNFNSPSIAREALEIGVKTVVVGSAITRPQWIAEKFMQKMYG